MTILLLHGRAALRALLDSAAAISEDAFSLIRQTKPDSAEREAGPAPRISPRTGRPTNGGPRGTAAMRSDSQEWYELKAGIVGAVPSESMQWVVAATIDDVIQSGSELISASRSAVRTTDALWGKCYSDFAEAVGKLRGIRRHVPAEATSPDAGTLLTLIHRLIDFNGQITTLGEDGDIEGWGFPADRLTQMRKQTWLSEIQEASKYGPHRLDRTWIEQSERTPAYQRAMTVIFQLMAATEMMEQSATAKNFRAALTVVCEQPYWRVHTSERWGRLSKRRSPVELRFPWMAAVRPIDRRTLAKLLKAGQSYADSKTAGTSARHGFRRPIPTAAAAKALNVRPDGLRKKLERRGYPIAGSERKGVAELDHVIMCYPERRKALTKWADDKYPAE